MKVGARSASPWARRILIGVVVGYALVLVLAPVGALLVGAFRQGVGAALAVLAQPEVLTAFGLTLWISLVVVAVHAVFGTLVAWVLVRQRFAGRALLNSLIDLPFAISPVVVGYMLLLFFGRNGLLAPVAALLVGAFREGVGAAVAVLAQAEVLDAFGLTLWISLVVVAVHAVFGTLVAWALVRQRFPGRALLNSLIDLPFAISPVVVGYMLLLLFGRNGLLAPLLERFNLHVAFALPGMILATLFVTLPFMVRELVPVLEAFGVQQERAAATLGASGWQTFWRVTLPALRWGFLYGLTLTFARALGEFGAVLIIGGGIQGRTETTTLFIYRSLAERQYTQAYMAALVLGLFSFGLVLGMDWLRRRQ
jgi:sulfate/thiosulfate transport system permease protein